MSIVEAIAAPLGSRSTDRGRPVHSGEVLGPEAGIAAACPNVADDDRGARGQAKRQRGAQDLTASFTRRAVDLDHFTLPPRSSLALSL